MRRLAVNLLIAGKKVVVVGGGKVASRKVRSVLDAGGDVRVIAPDLTPDLRELAAADEIVHVPRSYRSGDLEGAVLVFAATSDRDVNRAVTADAEDRGILVTVADDPDSGTFTSPAVVRRGDLLLTVSTGDENAGFARAIRKELEATYGPEYGEALRLSTLARRKLLTELGNTSYNTGLAESLLASDLPGMLKRGETDRANRLLEEVLASAISREREEA